jgi:hypothetical protein
MGHGVDVHAVGGVDLEQEVAGFISNPATIVCLRAVCERVEYLPRAVVDQSDDVAANVRVRER